MSAEQLDDIAFGINLALGAASENVARISQILDSSYQGKGLCSEAIDRRRYNKIAQEYAEVDEAYSGTVGENPRKGVTNTIDDVCRECLDVALAALGAREHFLNRGDSFAALAAHAKQVADRLASAVAEPLPVSVQAPKAVEL